MIGYMLEMRKLKPDQYLTAIDFHIGQHTLWEHFLMMQLISDGIPDEFTGVQTGWCSETWYS